MSDKETSFYKAFGDFKMLKIKEFDLTYYLPIIMFITAAFVILNLQMNFK